MSALATTELPTETWTHIIQYLRYSHQMPFLHVSRAFHAITIRFVFSAIRIYFVGKESAEFLATSHGPPLPAAEVLEQNMQRSWEILQYIKDNPEFASVVRTVSVVAVADSQSIFEKRESFHTFSEIIQRLYSVFSVSWAGPPGNPSLTILPLVWNVA